MSRKIVVYNAWRRPDYTRTSLQALAKCRGISDYKVQIMVDGGGQRGVAETAVNVADDCGLDWALHLNDHNLGVAGAPLEAMRKAFGQHHADFIVRIEDDAVLTPDALELADWYLDLCSREPRAMEKYLLMGLCDHENKDVDFPITMIDKRGGVSPEYLLEHYKLTSPFAFCLCKENFPFVEKYWNCKTQIPYGWDWSLTYVMRLKEKFSLAPILSRCQNIGRDGGVHDTHETFDRMQTGITYSTGQLPIGQFVVGNTLLPLVLGSLTDWMLAEYERGMRP